MSDVVFLVDNATFTAPIASLTANCTLFQAHPELTSEPYGVRSPISAEVFAVFFGAVQNGCASPLEVNPSNAVGLALLCGEFGFWEIAGTLSVFDLSGGGSQMPARRRLLKIEERLSQQERRLSHLTERFSVWSLFRTVSGKFQKRIWTVSGKF
jgi:hypothetical protein